MARPGMIGEAAKGDLEPGARPFGVALPEEAGPGFELKERVLREAVRKPDNLVGDLGTHPFRGRVAHPRGRGGANDGLSAREFAGEHLPLDPRPKRVRLRIVRIDAFRLFDVLPRRAHEAPS